MPTLAAARSFLFAPGSEERKLVKALAAGADVVIADLEDAVAPDEKVRARALAVRLLSEADTRSLRLVRVNALGTPWHQDDLAALGEGVADGIVLPKASPEAAAGAADLDLPVVAIVETADGLRRAHALAGTPSVVALMLGAVDLGVELGLEQRPDGLELLFARSALVVDSAAAGIRPPIDQVWTDVRDRAGLERDCALARSLGFRAKACIHPDQVPVVNDAFTPSDEEVAAAREVVAAYEAAVAEGRGVFALDGRMVDLPVVERARRILATAERSVAHVE